MTNLEKYDQVFREVFGAEESQLGESFTFQDVEKWDSLIHLTLIVQLEDAFGIMIDPEDIMTFGSYENGKAILARCGVTL